ncbi:hypothetical protein FDB24_16390 [Clostridium botulinum]|uniref:hypothetical protein n=1 Tax=Clostridium botulinum TaxID=1491 RepID=UPI00077370AA|nr:hypothetical protein [Clostridium botulinum]NFL88078.1 hypothetical protein [Clostridium botulinum]NFO22791.1 hypothetical protein [Clostridium botulinum]
MPSEKFNLTGLKNIYLEALSQDDGTLIFEVIIGRGRFLFMMFFSEDDGDSRDLLFIFMRNTHQLVKYKLYGSHKKGDFYIYVDDLLRVKLTNELLLANTGNLFSFKNFLVQLNNNIPTILLLATKIQKFRENWNELKTHGLTDMLDESEKTVLIGEKRLPKGQKPQEKTLRKLYLYTEGDSADIEKLITSLKKANMTVRWTRPNNQINPADIRQIMNKLK